MFKIKITNNTQTIAQQKEEKLAQTARYLHSTRKMFRAEVPVSFRPRSTAMYYGFYQHK